MTDVCVTAGARDRLEGADLQQHAVIAAGAWLRKGVWAIADKGLVNGSNFAVNIALARWLLPQDYGAFALASTIFLLLGSGHTALLTDPMLVFGAGTYRDRSPAYLAVLLQGHWAFTAAASVVLFAAALGVKLAGHNALSSALVAFGFASPFILLHWLLRQTCYMRLDAHQAAYAGISYTLTVIMGAGVLYHGDWLSPATGIALMGVASLAAALQMFASLRRQRPHAQERQLFHDIVADHWRYGRWSLGSYALAWIEQSTYYLLLPVWGGLGAAGSLKAIVNLTQPITHTYGALSFVLVPALVGAGQGTAFSRIARRALGLLALGAFLYWMFLGVGHRAVVHWLYNGQYDADAGLLWIVAAIPIVYAGEIVLGSVLRSRERPRDAFLAYMLSAGSALTLGAALVAALGLRGAAVGLLCSSIATVGMMAWLLRRDSWTLTRVSGNEDGRWRRV
jgi:O-antigen/teichoic acid export membrane protein